MTRSYVLALPVFEQGDDLQFYLISGDIDAPSKALLDLATQYEDAARICRRVAGVIKETGEDMCSAWGQEHEIVLEGPEEALAGLIEDGLLEEKL